MTVQEIIELMEELLDNSSAVPFSSKKLIDCEQMRDYIDNLSLSMPAEIKKAQETEENRDKIIADANIEADKIRAQADEAVEAAKNKVKELVSETEIIRQAKSDALELIRQAQAEAEEILAQAREKDAQIRAALTENVTKTLTEAREVLQKNLDDVNSTITAVESLNAPAAQEEKPAEEE